MMAKKNQEFGLSKEFAGNENDYPKYDYCNGINVDKPQDIPRDYKGLMGVPITFLHKLSIILSSLKSSNFGRVMTEKI